MRRSPGGILIVAVAAALSVASCSPSAGVRCGPGTHADGGLCVPDEPDAADGGEAEAGDGDDGTAGEESDGAAEDGGPGDVPTIRCRDEWDCPPDLICVDSACTPPPLPCGSDLDCPRDLVCDHGSCVAECGFGTDSCECGAEAICVDHRCTTPPATCARDEDCPCVGEVNRCVGGACVAECTPPCGCVEGWSCAEDHCVPAPDGCTFDDECLCRGIGYTSDAVHCFDGLCGRPCTGPCDCSVGLIANLACVDGRCTEWSGTCRTDADCPCAGDEPARCIAGLCLVPCATNCDCDSPAAGGRSLCIDGFCQVPLGPCTGDAECPCAAGIQTTCDAGTCHNPPCITACDCPAGFRCVDGECSSGTAWDCGTDDDCPCGQPCVSDSFVSYCGCWDNTDCAFGTVCDVATRTCGPPPATCASNLDCPYADGWLPLRCVDGACTYCGMADPCWASDAGCATTCDDGTTQICHHALANPDDDANSYCAPPCSSNLDCQTYFPYPGGVCLAGRCTISADDLPDPCTTDDDCPALGTPAGGGRFVPVCRHGDCVPASCESSCDCPLWPRPQICVAGACERAPAECSTVDDCPCLNSGQMGCNAPGVCGPPPG